MMFTTPGDKREKENNRNPNRNHLIELNEN